MIFLAHQTLHPTPYIHIWSTSRSLWVMGDSLHAEPRLLPKAMHLPGGNFSTQSLTALREPITQVPCPQGPAIQFSIPRMLSTFRKKKQKQKLSSIPTQQKWGLSQHPSKLAFGESKTRSCLLLLIQKKEGWSQRKAQIQSEFFCLVHGLF